MQCHMKWKALLFCISAAIVILLINAITGWPQKDSTEPYALARSQPKAEEDFQGQPKKDSTESLAWARSQPKMDQLMCPKAVEATVGGNVTLDFHFKSQRNVARELIEWKFNNSIYVLVYRSRGVSGRDQADQFKSRASLESIDNITKGKLAVKISSLTNMDAGTYSCFVGRGKERRSCSIQLITGERVGHIKAAALNRSGTTYALVLAASTLLYLLYD